jgi:hypothetical protein
MPIAKLKYLVANGDRKFRSLQYSQNKMFKEDPDKF